MMLWRGDLSPRHKANPSEHPPLVPHPPISYSSSLDEHFDIKADEETTMGDASNIDMLRFDLSDLDEGVLHTILEPVSYTHLTLPTICSV